jgi:flagellar hook-length control protein FliK
MSMSTVQFEPKITTDLQIDWRRPASQGADPFADLLKRHFEIDRPDRAPKRRDEAADPVSGRPPRVTIAHARTLRGEAKEIEDADRRLMDQTDHEEGCANTIEETAAPEEGPEGTEASTDSAPTDGAPTEAQAESEATAAADQPPAPVEHQTEATDPALPIVVPTQSAAEPAATGQPETIATPLVPTPAEDGQGLTGQGLTGQGLAPEPADQAADETPGETQASTGIDAAAAQPAITAMAETSLTDVVAALTTGQAVPAEGAAATAAAAQPMPAPAAALESEQPLLQTLQIPTAATELAAATAPRPDRSAMDIKLRPSTAPRAHAGAGDPAPSAAAASHSSQAHQAPLLQAGSAGEPSGSGETFDHPLLDEGIGQGWTLHLAQGAAGKRADFVAQLRQHLQNLPAHEQVAVHVQRALREGTNKFSIQLSPAELGKIHVKLEIDEEKRVTAAVTVERPSTLELLQRDVKGLERALHNAGLNMEGGDLSFSLGHGSDQEFAQDLHRSAASAAGGAVRDGDSDSGQPVGPAAQVMDTAAGVVNLQV